MNTKKLLASVLLVSGGLFTVSASAAVIPTWEWVTDGGFRIGEGTCSNGPTEASCLLQYDNTSGVTPSGIAGTASVMTWGVGSFLDGGNGNQSGLQTVNGESGEGPYNAQLLGSGPVPIPEFEQIVTNDGWTNIGAAVHYNNVILTEGGHMQTSILTTSFQLLTPGSGPVLETDIDIVFNETENTEPCPSPNPLGTVCDDVFTVSLLPSPVFFTIDGQLYKLRFQYAAGEGTFVNGTTVYTSETAPGTAILFSQARIDTIPVPGVLGLMGMGLLLMGWQVRSRKSA